MVRLAADVERILRDEPVAWLSTARPDGRPHLIPIWFWWDGTSIYMETPPTFVKAKNLVRNPQCAISVDVTEGGLRFKAVVLEGPVELIADRQFILDMVTRIYTKYLGVEGAQSPTPQRMINSEHVIIKLTPAKVLTWDDTRTALAPVP